MCLCGSYASSVRFKRLQRRWAIIQSSLLYNTHFVSKKFATCCLTTTLANVDWFWKFFHQLISKKKFCMYVSQRFPAHLQYVSTLLFESQKSRFSVVQRLLCFEHYLTLVAWTAMYEKRSRAHYHCGVRHLGYESIQHRLSINISHIHARLARATKPTNHNSHYISIWILINIQFKWKR